MTQRIGFLVKWSLTQRIEPSLLHNPKNWFFFLTQRIEPFLSDRTQRIEPFLFESKTWELAFEHDSMIWASFLHDSKNWTFSGIWLNGLNTFVRAQVTQSTEPFLECVSNNWVFFLNVTRRINFLFTWLKEFNNFFFNMTQRIVLFFWVWLKELFFLILKEYNLFFNMTRRLQLFDSKIWTLLKYESKIWTLLKYESKIWTLFKYKSRNWTLYWNMTQGIEHFIEIWLKELNTFWTRLKQRVEYFFWIRGEELNLFSIWLRGLNFFFFNMTYRIEHMIQNVTLRIEPFFFWYDPKDCFSLVTQRNEHFLWIRLKELNTLNTIQKNWTFSQKKKKKSKNWNFLTGLKELNLFFSTYRKELSPLVKLDSKEWTGFSKIWLKELNFLHKKNGLLSKKNDSKNWTFLKIFWLQELKTSCDSGDGTFSIWIKDLCLFFQQIHSKMVQLL